MPLYKLSDADDSNNKKATRILKKPDYTIKSDILNENENDSSPKAIRRKKLRDMTVDEQVSAAKETILNILSMVAKSRKQLFDRLLEKGHTEEVANIALDRLAEVGIIDDVNFAAQWVSSRHTGSGLAPYAIKRELILKGIDENIIEEALQDLSEEDLNMKALEIAKRKARSVRGDRNSKIKKIASAVARKGYSSSLSFQVAKQAIEDMGESVDDVQEES